MANAVLGIDPGKKGGWALLTDSGAILNLGPLWNVDEMALFFKNHFADRSRVHVFLEKVQSFGVNKPSAMLNYGIGFGHIEGMLRAFKYSYTLVPPQTWCRPMHAGCNSKDKPKEKSMEAVKKLFPHADLIAEGCRKEHDGIIEALLIAEYGRRQLYCSKSR